MARDALVGTSAASMAPTLVSRAALASPASGRTPGGRIPATRSPDAQASQWAKPCLGMLRRAIRLHRPRLARKQLAKEGLAMSIIIVGCVAFVGGCAGAILLWLVGSDDSPL